MKTMSSSIALAVLFFCLTTHQASAQAPGQTLLDQVKQAYAKQKAYEATLHFTMEQKAGRWIKSQKAWIRIVYDRPGGRLLVDKPELQLTVRDGSVQVVSEQLPGRFLDAAQPPKLTLTSLMQEVPMLETPMLVGLAFLLESDPIDLITAGGTSLATPLGIDPQDSKKRPRLEVGTAEGNLVMSFNPDTLLLDEAVFALSFNTGNPGDYARLIYRYEYKQPAVLKDSLFQLKTTGMVAADNFKQYVEMQPPPGISGTLGAGGQASATAKGTGALVEGVDAPPIDTVWIDSAKGELKTFKLDEVEEPIVLIHFWASWLPMAYDSMPMVESLRDWAAKTKLPVTILTLNAGDNVQEVRRFLRTEKLDLPVVMDREFKISESFQATTLPLTVIIVDGKIRHAYNGYVKDMGDLLKEELKALDKTLREEKATEEKDTEEQATPDEP